MPPPPPQGLDVRGDVMRLDFWWHILSAFLLFQAAISLIGLLRLMYDVLIMIVYIIGLGIPPLKHAMTQFLVLCKYLAREKS
jgi:uncharacterized membrane protein YhaH (DUF805 family)